MKALFVTAAFSFLLLGGLLRGDQSSAPTTQAEEIAQLRKHIETLEERVERLERRLDRKFQPRVVPLTGIKHPENSSENGTVEWESLSPAAISCPRAKHPNRRSESGSHILRRRNNAA